MKLFLGRRHVGPNSSDSDGQSYATSVEGVKLLSEARSDQVPTSVIGESASP